MSTRKGPTASASGFPIGTRKRGNDKRMWSVRKTSAGVRRWVPVTFGTEARAAGTKARAVETKARAAEKKARTATKARAVGAKARAVGAKARAAPRIRTASPAHRIAFCEPYTYGRSRHSRAVTFKASDHLYALLQDAPKSYKSDAGNAYIFGYLRPLSSYVRLGSHGNHTAQTGFLDRDRCRAGSSARVAAVIRQAFNEGGKFQPWDDRAALRRARAELPCILFLGATFGRGGDAGATLYARRAAPGGEITDLIVDDGYFFPRGGLSAPR